MRKKISFIILCAVLVLVIAAAGIFYSKYSDVYVDKTDLNTQADDIKNTETSQEKDETPEDVSENIVPDVEFFDEDGNPLKLSNFFDKPVVFNFWATWCGPCKSEMPGFDNIYKKYKDKVNFIMLNVSDNRKTVEKFMAENGYSFPIYYDDTQICSYTYGASSIPMTFVLKEGGEIFGYQIGVLPEEVLETALKTILGEE